MLRGLKVSVIPGVGPVTQEKLHRIGIHLVGELQGFSVDELAQVVGRTHAQSLTDLAYARDDRAVEPERETKSISVEDTFETDRVDLAELRAILHRDAAAGRRPTARRGPVRPDRHDQGPAARLLDLHPLANAAERDRQRRGDQCRRPVVARRGRRDRRRPAARRRRRRAHRRAAGGPVRRRRRGPRRRPIPPSRRRPRRPSPKPTGTWRPGADVEHDDHGRGWVWGSGLGRVTVRFETRETPPGPVRTFSVDDPALRRTG